MENKLEKTVFVRDLKPKMEVDTVFFIKHLAKVEARDGKFYLDAVFSDASGSIQARKWQEIDRIFQYIRPGNYVRAKGKANLYQNRLQLIVTTIERVDEKLIDPQEFIVRARSNSETMYKKLLGLVENLDDIYIKNLLRNILQDPEIVVRLKKWQAGKTIHHAYQGGLLEHILSCAELAVLLSPLYSCNENYVVAGAVLHDLCKIYEFTEGPLVEYTDKGKLVGHLVDGPELVDRFTGNIPDFPDDTKMHLKHILLSHHGHLEYGSPKPPLTPEAYLVYLIDHLDSKMNSILQIIERDMNMGQWTSLSKHLPQSLFKGRLPHYTRPRKEKPSISQFKNNSLAKQLEKFSVEQ
ncbi:MAG: HD domain-containing protein [Halobacteriovoraceae bacterium]|nr:HD domain-containing protein [Halobacteriovoraceae bacterium]